MRYHSTRSSICDVSATEALLNGIAPDGGLYVPAQKVPHISLEPNDSFISILEKLLAIFFDSIPVAIRKDAVRMLESRFPKNPIPLTTFENLTFLELFQGPTAAFKDVALTTLPKLLQFAAKEHGKSKVLILTATSGDTGSAAMSGFSNIEGVEVMTFYPEHGTSDIQKRQMICQTAKNVSAIALKGHFDDAQRAVKHIFTSPAIRAQAEEKKVWLSSANSINIGRLFPQISYYLYLSNQLPQKTIDVVVPTGNFGNILAAYFAKKMGAKLGKLVIASNENCAVSEFIKTGIYNSKRLFQMTHSPSMDILVSSNVERLLLDLALGDTQRVCAMMESLKLTGEFALTQEEHARLKQDFVAESANDQDAYNAIATIYQQKSYLMDPHTAIGYAVAQKLNLFKSENHVAIAATASPWKFPTTMLYAFKQPTGKNAFEDLRLLQSFTHQTARFEDLENAPIIHPKINSLETVDALVCAQF